MSGGWVTDKGQENFPSIEVWERKGRRQGKKSIVWRLIEMEIIAAIYEPVPECIRKFDFTFCRRDPETVILSIRLNEIQNNKTWNSITLGRKRVLIIIKKEIIIILQIGIHGYRKNKSLQGQPHWGLSLPALLGMERFKEQR